MLCVRFHGRGTDPDLILLDELTLLADSSAGVLQGVERASGISQNFAASADVFSERNRVGQWISKGGPTR